MADLAAFADDGFDPKAWINAACSNKSPDESLERFLSELEMRLQLGAEEIEASLTDASMAAMHRVPFAQQEVHRLRGDVSALRTTAASLLSSVHHDRSAAAATIAPLASLHRAKTNMEGACETLKEATELSGAFRRVEDVFAAGDLPRVADMLAAMSRSLALVGDVPEFREGKQKLAALEDRLQRRVEGRLSDAFNADNSQDVGTLARILLAVGRYTTLERLYCASRITRAVALWDEAVAPAAPASVGATVGGSSSLKSGWLLTYYNKMLELLRHESDWLGVTLTAQRDTLLAALIVSVFTKISTPLRERLSSITSIPVLTGLLNDALVMCHGLGELTKQDVSSELLAGAVKLVLEPLEDQVSKYSQLEDSQLSQQLSSAIAVDPNTEDHDTAVSKLSGGCAGAFGALTAAVERCMTLSGGTELKGLLGVIDSQTQQYLTRLQAAVSILQDRYQRTRLGSGNETSQGVSAMLQLVLMSQDVVRHLSSLETLMRSTIATAIPRLEALAASGPRPGSPPDLLSLRLLAFPKKLKPLSKLRTQSQESRFIALPSATSAADLLCASISSAVYDALLAPVVSALTPLPGLPEWMAGASAASLAGHVPTFSASPLPLVTSVGEYMMALPQPLEVLIQEDSSSQLSATAAATAATAGSDDVMAGGAAGDELAAEWLDKVVRGAGVLYADTVMQIKELSSLGASQLAADAEYFCNVMSALAVAPSPVLITVQLFTAVAADQFADAANGAVADGSADVKVLKALAGMRGIEWDATKSMQPQQQPPQQQEQQAPNDGAQV
eukprot:jgi/Chrzof1/4307/Cz14g08100.t1